MRLPTAIILFFLWACSPSPPDQIHSRADIDGLINLADKLSQTNSDTALSIARSAYELSAAYKYQSGLGHSSLLMGNILYEIGGLNTAIEQLNESLKVFSDLEDKEGQASANIALGKVYQRSENYTQAFLYLLQALKYYDDLNNEHGLAEVYGNLGHLYEKTQAYDSALLYQKRALEYYSIAGDTIGLADIHDNIGSIYEDQGDAELSASSPKYKIAFQHFQTALLLNQSVGNYAGAVVNLNNIGDVFRKQNDLINAIRYTNQALALAEKANLDYQVKSAARDLSKIYFSQGDIQHAFDALERSYELTDNIFSEQIAEEIAKTQTIYELEQKQQRIALLEKEQKLNQNLVWLSSAASVMFLLLGGLIFYQQRSKNHKKRKLLETEAVLAKAELENAQLNEQNLKAELENKMLREDQLRQELELKSKSLTKSALHMIQKNEFLGVLRSRIKELKKGDEVTMQKRVKKLIKSIDFNFTLDDDWQEFETIFQQVHSNFFLRLKEMYPDLTPSEVRLCAMIRLNLHSKDMAAIMGISQDSLRISRYRLRKKLGLKKGANLYAFIINIGD